MFSGRSSLILIFAAATLSTVGCSDDGDDTSGNVSSSGMAAGGAGGGQGGAGGSGGIDPNELELAVRNTAWEKLANAPSVTGGRKQDDIYFLNADKGFVANGPGEAIAMTVDGGATWSDAFQSSGTFFRALLFLDDQHGFAGNLGTGLIPSVTDATVIYETTDGGVTWDPVTNISGPAPSGICNFYGIDETSIVGVGRTNAPSHMVLSTDAGASWVSTDLSPWLSMPIDAHFESPTVGIVAGMGPGNVCTIVRTTDGGATFDTVFASATSGSLCWKLDFPSDQVGYVAVQDSTNGPATFGKTTDGGATWVELPLPITAAYPAIGVGFINENIGWMVSADPSAAVYRTFDGGVNWEQETVLKGPINRFRFVDETTAYAVGADVWKLTLELP